MMMMVGWWLMSRLMVEIVWKLLLAIITYLPGMRPLSCFDITEHSGLSALLAAPDPLPCALYVTAPFSTVGSVKKFFDSGLEGLFEPLPTCRSPVVYLAFWLYVSKAPEGERAAYVEPAVSQPASHHFSQLFHLVPFDSLAAACNDGRLSEH
jgi:hypothetical protein